VLVAVGDVLKRSKLNTVSKVPSLNGSLSPRPAQTSICGWLALQKVMAAVSRSRPHTLWPMACSRSSSAPLPQPISSTVSAPGAKPTSQEFEVGLDVTPRDLLPFRGDEWCIFHDASRRIFRRNQSSTSARIYVK
jgi:hypothetical protein